MRRLWLRRLHSVLQLHALRRYLRLCLRLGHLRLLGQSERLRARLDVKVVYIVVVYDVCDVGARLGLAVLKLLLSGQLGGRRRHERRLADERGPVRHIAVVDLSGQLRRWLLLALHEELSRCHLLLHDLIGLDLGRARFIDGTRPSDAAFLDHLRRRLERLPELVKALAHHLGAGGQRDRVGAPRWLRRQQFVSSVGVAFIGAQFPALNRLLRFSAL